MDEIPEIIDNSGQLRRCGSLVLPAGFVSAFPTFESKYEVWDDEKIKRVITADGRVPRRVTFSDYWIQDQKSHGSCNGFAGAGVYAKARFLRGIRDRLRFSGAMLYGQMNRGRDNGSMLEDGLKHLQADGICEEKFAGWDAIYPARWAPGAKENAALHKGLACYAAETLQGVRTGLAKGFPCVIAVQAGGNFQRLNAKGVAGVDSGSGNHAIHADDLCMVGGTEVFDAVNSWGLGYGTNGRAYLTADSFAGTFRSHAFYLIGSTAEGDDNG